MQQIRLTMTCQNGYKPNPTGRQDALISSEIYFITELLDANSLLI